MRVQDLTLHTLLQVTSFALAGVDEPEDEAQRRLTEYAAERVRESEARGYRVVSVAPGRVVIELEIIDAIRAGWRPTPLVWAIQSTHHVPKSEALWEWAYQAIGAHLRGQLATARSEEERSAALEALSDLRYDASLTGIEIPAH